MLIQIALNLERLMSFPLLVLAGCMHSYVLSMSDPNVDAHYVLVQSGAGTQKVYDCLSRPDGQTWNPTCVKADMRSEAPGTEAK